MQCSVESSSCLILSGNNFEIALTFQSKNGTGTGEIAMNIDTQDGIPLGQSQYSAPLQPGTYTVKWTGEAAPDPDCDPTQGPCEMWLAGNYTVNVGE